MKTANRISVYQIGIVAALAFTVVVNVLATALPINGQTTAEIANRIPIFFLPANYVFSIWGVIYTGLIIYAIFQVRPSQRANPDLRAISVPFMASCIANAAWLILFHYEAFPASMIAMLVLLVLLIWIYQRLRIGRKAVGPAFQWAVHVPFSIYTGWITVATVANATYVLFDLGWDGLGIAGEVWAAILIVVASIITLRMIQLSGDVAYTLVAAWAFIGILVRFSNVPVLAYTAGGMTAVILLALAARWFIFRPRANDRLVAAK